jgi:Skp family chaperone for outer membrane proteins
MKMKWILLKNTAACLVLNLFLSGMMTWGAEPVMNGGLKIGFVDFEKVFNEYKRTREENQKLQRAKEEKEKSAQSLIDEINKMKTEAEILSEDAKVKTENEIKEKLRHLRDFTEDSKKELLDERNVIFKKITDEIRSIIEIKGKEGNFSLIMDDKALFYKESALDLTEEVIIILNDDAKKAEILKPKSNK